MQTDYDKQKTYVLSLTEWELGEIVQALTLRAISYNKEREAEGSTSFPDLDRTISEFKHARPKDADELERYADDILRSQYFDSVRSHAKSILEDLESGEYGTEEDEARESVQERLHEDADGSSWVIYTSSAMQVLRYSDNDSAYVDNFGTDGIVEDGNIHWSRLAYAAFHADISEIVWTDFENWKETIEGNRAELENAYLEPSDVQVMKLSDGTYLVHVPADGVRERDWTVVLGDRGELLEIQHGVPLKEGGKLIDVLLLPEPIVSGIAQAYLETSEATWDVVVSNLGTVYSGPSEEEARQHFADYVELTKNPGRAQGGTVTLMEDGEIVEEEIPETQEKEGA